MNAQGQFASVPGFITLPSQLTSLGFPVRGAVCIPDDDGLLGRRYVFLMEGRERLFAVCTAEPDSAGRWVILGSSRYDMPLSRALQVLTERVCEYV